VPNSGRVKRHGDPLHDRAGSAGLAYRHTILAPNLSADWPGSRLVEIWNSFAGVAPFGELKPVKEYQSSVAGIRYLESGSAGAGAGPLPH